MRDEPTGSQVEWAPQSWFAFESGFVGPGAYFDHRTSAYQAFRHEQVIRTVRASGGMAGRARLVDLGCAVGDLTDRCRQAFGVAEAIGVDFLPQVLEAGRTRYPLVTFLEGRLPDIPVPSQSCDAVLASEVLYYLTESGRNAAREAIRRVLRPGGILVVSAVLGPGYPTLQDWMQEFGDEWEVVARRSLHLRLYHALTRPVGHVVRLEAVVSGRNTVGSGARWEQVNRWLGMLRLLPFRIALKWGARVGRLLLQLHGLPRMCSMVGCWSHPTSIVLVLRLASGGAGTHRSHGTDGLTR